MKDQTAVIVVILITLLGVAVVSTAQESVRPGDYADGSSCEAKATKHLLAAVDPTQRDWQEWNLNAAQAYKELAALGFQEC